MADEQHNTRYARAAGLMVALFFAWFLQGVFHDWWNDYWIRKDTRTGIAFVTGKAWTGHGVVEYWYTVDGSRYSGKCWKNYRDPKYGQAGPGEKVIVYYSASHPWISCLRTPQAVGEGLPVVILVLFFEAFAIITVIDPGSGWAFNFRRRNALPQTANRVS